MPVLVSTVRVVLLRRERGLSTCTRRRFRCPQEGTAPECVIASSSARRSLAYLRFAEQLQKFCWVEVALRTPGHRLWKCTRHEP